VSANTEVERLTRALKQEKAERKAEQIKAAADLKTQVMVAVADPEKYGAETDMLGTRGKLNGGLDEALEKGATNKDLAEELKKCKKDREMYKNLYHQLDAEAKKRANELKAQVEGLQKTVKVSPEYEKLMKNVERLEAKIVDQEAKIRMAWEKCMPLADDLDEHAEDLMDHSNLYSEDAPEKAGWAWIGDGEALSTVSIHQTSLKSNHILKPLDPVDHVDRVDRVDPINAANPTDSVDLTDPIDNADENETTKSDSDPILKSREPPTEPSQSPKAPKQVFGNLDFVGEDDGELEIVDRKVMGSQFIKRLGVTGITANIKSKDSDDDDDASRVDSLNEDTSPTANNTANADNTATAATATAATATGSLGQYFEKANGPIAHADRHKHNNNVKGGDTMAGNDPACCSKHASRVKARELADSLFELRDYLAEGKESNGKKQTTDATKSKEDLIKENGALQADITFKNKKLQKLTGQVDKLEAKVDQQRGAWQKGILAGKKAVEKDEELAKLKASLTEAETEKEALQNGANESTQDQKEADEKLSKLESELEKLKAELAQSESEKEALQEEKNEFNELIKELDDKMSNLEDELARLKALLYQSEADKEKLKNELKETFEF